MKALTGAFMVTLVLFILLISPSYLPERTDVLVIGAGAAGMRAALESRSVTEKVILLEKMPYPGGNSNRATAGFNAVLDEKDIPSFIKDTNEAGGNRGNPVLIERMARDSADALQWLRSLGADLKDKGLLAGHSRSRTYRPSGGSPVGAEITSFLYREIRNRDIDLRLENRALTILRSKKGLTVFVENRTGREYRIKAKAVIIATGGFGGNTQLVARFNPALKGFHTTNSAGATGDFLGLCENLPVQYIGLADIQTHPTVEPEFSLLITEALRGNGGILVNRQGERFTDEMDFREALSRKILEQKDRFAWLIFDQSVRDSLQSAEYYFDKQLVREAPGILSLAEELSLPGMILKETIREWNHAVQDGFDPRYDRKDLLHPLVTPPFYAIKVTPGIHYCMGGLAIDSQARVLDRENTPIPGLYAAGEATGGIHGKDRLGGNSLTDAMVFGKVAGREASRHAIGQ